MISERRVFLFPAILSLSLLIGSLGCDKDDDSTNQPPQSETPEGMVLVEATSFQMGTTNFDDSAMPIHQVDVPAFYIDKYEVTNAQYRAFCTATGHTPPPDVSRDGMPNYFTNPAWDNYPVGIDNWQDAKDYCDWRGPGYRLPTEAEWELAAKGSTDDRLYPWGDTWIGANANHWNNPEDGHVNPSPVGSYPDGISTAGCYDMAGNIFEWCEDDWHENYIDAPSDGSAWVDQPRGSNRVRRGGSYNGSNIYGQCAYRTQGAPSGSYYASQGFRCAKTP